MLGYIRICKWRNGQRTIAELQSWMSWTRKSWFCQITQLVKWKPHPQQYFRLTRGCLLSVYMSQTLYSILYSMLRRLKLCNVGARLSKLIKSIYVNQRLSMCTMWLVCCTLKCWVVLRTCMGWKCLTMHALSAAIYIIYIAFLNVWWVLHDQMQTLTVLAMQMANF